jgi:ribonuclease P protein component
LAAGTEAGGSRSEKPFGSAFRLRTKAHMDAVRASGRSRAGKLCVAIAAPPEDGNRRVAFVISRRYSRKAVIRNRARRLFREAYRRLLPELKDGWIILLPRRYMQDAKMQDVLAELRKHLQALGYLVDRKKAEPEEGR